MKAHTLTISNGNVDDLLEVHTFIHDPLLLSCVLYRLVKENQNPIAKGYSLTDQTTIEKYITAIDHKAANEISTYYSGKLLFSKLKGKETTKYRDDLYQYLVNRPLVVDNRTVGMIYKLPYFYEYDTKLNEIFDGTNILDITGIKHIAVDLNVSLVGKLDPYRKRNPVVEYWFKCDDLGNDTRILVQIEKKNPLITLLDEYLVNNKVMLSCKLDQEKLRDDYVYYKATGFDIHVAKD